MKKSNWMVAMVAATVVVACASSPAGTPLGTPSTTPDPVSDILARIGSPRLSDMTASGTTANVFGSASDAGAEATRTLWYENIAAAAFAQQVAIDQANREIVDDSGEVLMTELDPVTVGSQDAFAPLNVSADDIANAIASGAEALDAQVVSIEYVELFGGIAEIVIQPASMDAFIGSASTNIPTLLGDLATQEQRPYLVTVVNSDQSPLLVVGYTPAIGATGQGIAWADPDVTTDAIWGAPIGAT